MVNQAEEPLTRVTINLFEADVKWLKEHIGSGWQTEVRDMLRGFILQSLDEELHNE